MVISDKLLWSILQECKENDERCESGFTPVIHHPGSISRGIPARPFLQGSTKLILGPNVDFGSLNV